MIARPNPAFNLTLEQELVKLNEFDEKRRQEALRSAPRRCACSALPSSGRG